MSRNLTLIAAALLSLSLIATTSAAPMPTNAMTILPEECKLTVGEEMQLSLDGYVPSNAVVNWHVDEGGITSMLPGQSALFVAPSEQAIVTISVTISSGTPGMETLITRQCMITAPNQAPRGVA